MTTITSVCPKTGKTKRIRAMLYKRRRSKIKDTEDKENWEGYQS
jgi:hypothetical protein